MMGVQGNEKNGKGARAASMFVFPLPRVDRKTKDLVDSKPSSVFLLKVLHISQ